MRWDEFEQACPEIARLALDRFRTHELCLIGTLKKDGSPRISPCELDFAEGHLLLGMMWRSRKALDLLRDARCVLHSCTTNRDGTEGDAKLYGRVFDVQDRQLRDAYRNAVRARIDWAPEEPKFHVFAFDVQRAGYITFGEPKRVLAWNADGGLRELPFPDAE